MTIEEALTILDGVLGQETLNDTQELVFRYAWDDWTYERIAAQFGYAPDHIRNVGAHLWGLLSNVLGEKVTKSNFQSVLRRWAQQHLTLRKQPNPLPESDRIDLGDAPDASSLTGRHEELAILKQWIIVDRCRLVALLGMGGIGKTSLAVVLARQLSGNREQDEKNHSPLPTPHSPFDYVVWRSLRNSPPVMELLASLIQFLSDGREIDTTLPLDLNGRILRFIDYLRKHRCLVILDNAESVLSCHNGLNESRSATSDYQPKECERYMEFLERLCDLPHEGCLVLTSREKPEVIAWKEGLTLPVRSLQINGLNKTDSQKLFELKGAFSASDAEWQTLVHHYAGNPLALKMTAAAIQELFNSNISEFLTVLGTLVFDDIRDLLDRQFDRLSDVEKEVMYWLAINREVTSFTELRDDVLSPISKQKLPSTLRSLKHRFLIETSSTGFTQQPVVMEYVTGKLIEKVCNELRMKNEELGMEGREDLPILNSQFSILNSHALLKAIAKDYIRDSQTRLILAPIAERLQAEVGSKDAIAQHIQTLLSHLRFHQPSLATSPPPTPHPPLPIPHYGAGNLLNLLCYLKVDLTGFDFSNLAVWQAYLQEVNLHRVNFANADLARSTFVESLGEVWSVAFSPDAHLLAAGDSVGDIHLWRVADHQKRLTLQGHTNWVCSVAFSSNGKILASGSADGTLKLWDIATGQCIRTLQGHSDWMIAVAFSPNGQTVASCGIDAKTIRVWNVHTGECLKTLQGHEHWVCAICFATPVENAYAPTVGYVDSSDTQILVSGSDDHTLKIWNVKTGECLKTLHGHTSHVRSVMFSPDGRTLASGADDHLLKIWDAKTGECLKTLQGHTSNVRSLAFSADGQQVISASEDRTLKLWDVATGTCLKTLHGHTGHVRSVAFAPGAGSADRSGVQTVNGTVGAALIASGGADQTVRFWNSRTGQCLKTLRGYTSSILSVAFSPNGQLLASSSADHTIKLWDVNTHQYLQTLQGHTNQVWSVAFSPDGRTLASSSFDRTIKLWDCHTGMCLKTLQGHTHWVWSVAFSPDGATLASSSSDQMIRLWDSRTGQCLKTLQGHSSHVLAIAFSPDGNVLASSEDDGMVKLWNLNTNECFSVLNGHTSRVSSVRFSSDSQRLVSSSADQTIKVWDVQTGKCLRTLVGHTEPVESAVFRPIAGYGDLGNTQRLLGGTQLLVSSSGDRSVKLWNVDTGECLQTLEGHTRRVWSVAFSPDGQTLASGSEDETIRLWNVDTSKCLKGLRNPRPYEEMNVAGVTGLTDAQKVTLRALGAVG